MKLSVLDLVPVRTDQSTGDALAATLALAQLAESLGFERYWLAEHHNTPAVASTNPAVLISFVAAATSTLRVGSGGVMLPNHAPLVVSEQFALLEAAFPGRIDLGLGRAPGTDPVTSWALRWGGGGVTQDAANHFPEFVDAIQQMISPNGTNLAVSGRWHRLHATPHAVSVPTMWLLGSSDFSARLAAEKGLPFVFAHHFTGDEDTSVAMTRLYRDHYQPSEEYPEPRTFLTVNACVAPTAEEAEALARPNLIAMTRLRTGQAMEAQLTVEEAAATVVEPMHRAIADGMRSRWIVGTPESTAAEVKSLADQFEVDEVMIQPVAGSHEGADPRRSLGREQTIALLAEALR